MRETVTKKRQNAMVERVQASTREASAAVDEASSGVAKSNTWMEALKARRQPAASERTVAEDVPVPLGIEITDVARRLGILPTTLSRVLHGYAGISPDLAVGLERAGVSTARSWMTL